MKYLLLVSLLTVSTAFAGKINPKVEKFKFFINQPEALDDFYEVKLEEKDPLERTNFDGLEFDSIESNGEVLVVLRSKTNNEIFAYSTFKQEKESQL